PVGTIESRLTRARARLRAALANRGFTASALLTTALAGELARPPAALAASTLGAALRVAAGRAADIPRAGLAEEVLGDMGMNKLKAVVAAVLLTVSVFGAGLLGWRAQARPDGPHNQAATPQADKRLTSRVKSREHEAASQRVQVRFAAPVGARLQVRDL